MPWLINDEILAEEFALFDRIVVRYLFIKKELCSLVDNHIRIITE